MDCGYLRAIADPEKLEVDFQRLAVGNVDRIRTVHVIWIVAWISGTGKFVVLHVPTT